jgi:hypothetical protein
MTQNHREIICFTLQGQSVLRERNLIFMILFELWAQIECFQKK